MDSACNSDSDSDRQSRLDSVKRTAIVATMMLELAAAAPENHGGRKQGAAFHGMVSNLDGIAWQLPIKQDAPSTGSRPSGKRARPATPQASSQEDQLLRGRRGTCTKRPSPRGTRRFADEAGALRAQRSRTYVL